MELAWDPNPFFGGFIGGIGPFFRRRVLSRGAYFFASEISLSVSVFGQFHEALGGVQIPSTLDNILAIRDALNRLIVEIEKDVELIVLETIHRNADINSRNLISCVRKIYNRHDIVTEREVFQAIERLTKVGFIESKASHSPNNEPHFAFLYGMAHRGLAELAQSQKRLVKLMRNEQASE
jgi:hypothetical protein